MITIAVGLGAAIISFLIMLGFQETVKNKIYGFSSHILITKFTMNNSMQEQPFDFNINLVEHKEDFPMVSKIQEYAHKPGLIKTDDEVMGVIFKGVGQSFDLERFRDNMLEGEFIHLPDSGFSQEVVLSKIISDKVNVHVGEDIIVHFFQNPPRFRRFKVTGIYQTNLSEYYDSRIIIGDLRMIKGLNGWADSVAGGLEVFIDFDKYDRSALLSSYMSQANEAIWNSNLSFLEKIYGTGIAFTSFDFEQAALDDARERIGESMDYDLYIEKTSDKYIQVFEWLGLINRQVLILLGIILFVVCVNMISVVLILVMERTQMIGMLKALGSTNKLVRSVFIYSGVNLIAKGLFFGNALGIGLCYLQDKFKFMKLNPHDYYMSYVPIGWSLETILILNALIFAIVTIVLLVPTKLITNINPIKAIRFD